MYDLHMPRLTAPVVERAIAARSPREALDILDCGLRDLGDRFAHLLLGNRMTGAWLVAGLMCEQLAWSIRELGEMGVACYSGRDDGAYDHAHEIAVKAVSPAKCPMSEIADLLWATATTMGYWPLERLGLIAHDMHSRRKVML